MGNANMIEFHRDNDCANVRVHGNGFIQAELADGSKMHIWARDCPCQEEPTFIHNHTSGFRSHILHGVLRNEEYGLREYSLRKGNPNGATVYQQHEAVTRHDKDTTLEPNGTACYINTKRVFFFAKGTTYEFPGHPDLFHATYPATDLVVTRVVRLEKEPPYGSVVLVEDGKKPDNVFDRYAHDEYAMETYLEIKRMLRPR